MNDLNHVNLIGKVSSTPKIVELENEIYFKKMNGKSFYLLVKIEKVENSYF